MRLVERIPIVLKYIDWNHFLKYIGCNDFDSEYIISNIGVITSYWLNNPDLRLTQVLTNLNVIPNLFGSKYFVEETDYLIEYKFVKPEKIIFWGTYGKDGKQPLKYVALDDMESSHIEASLKIKTISIKIRKILEKILRNRKLKILDMAFTAWRKGDLIKMPNGEHFRLTTEAYEKKPGRYYCDTDNGKSISYLKLMNKAKLIETGSGIKNETY